MKKKYISFGLPVFFFFILLGNSFSSKAQVNLVVNSSLCFSAMDNNPAYDEDAVAGQITVHSLLIQNGGSINYNDPGNPCSAAGVPNDSARSVTIIVINNMEIEAGGSINTENKIQGGNGGNIFLVVGGSFTMWGPSGGTPGAKISSSNLTATSGGKNAGNITIHAAGHVDIKSGATITAFSFKGTGGTIEITSNNNIDINGNVLSQSTGSGTGTNQGHGGMIWISTVQNLFVGDDAVISSKGLDPGADLVHLCGCTVIIYGLVESTGSGHGIPSNPPNHLNNTFRPDKPSNSTAGVEIWSGSTILIDNLNHNGEINADLCCAGGANGESWIDLFSRGPLTIIGKTVPYNNSIQNSNFAVHANGTSGNTDNGGTITIKSINSSVTASGLAVQADGTEFGGLVVIEAVNAVTLNNATLFARGDVGFNGGNGKGGNINIRSFQQTISWQNGLGDVRPTGGTIPVKGLITFKKCTVAVNVTGTVFPDNGAPATSPQTLADECGGSPSLQSYVVFCNCSEDSPPPCSLTGPTTVCAGTTGHQYDGGPIPTGYTFHWSVTGAGASINGADDQQTVTIDAGSVNYTVTLTMTPTGQGEEVVCPYPVTVNQNPTVYTLSGDDFCAGGTGSLTLSNSQTGVSYQLKKSSDNSNVQSAKNGTGASLTWTGLAAGSYYVVATGASPTFCTSQTDPAAIDEIDGPTIYSLTGSSICASDPGTGTITLSDSDLDVSYQLKKSSDNSNVQSAKSGTGSSLVWTGLAAGSYYVLATSEGFECSSQTNPASVTVVNNPTVYTLSGSSYCAGNSGSVTLSNSQTGVSYQLKNSGDNSDVQSPKNGTGSSLTWTGLAAGSYYVVATGAAPTNCTSQTSPATVTEITCDGHIFPTGVACSDYVNGTPELDMVCVTYGRNGKVSNATPGVFFYYTFITAPANNGSFTVDIEQSSDCSDKLFAIQKNQVVAWSSTCSKLTTGTEDPKGSGQGHITISGVAEGTTIVISVKYDTKSIIGANLTSPCTFNFVSKIGGVAQPNSAGSIVATECNPAITNKTESVEEINGKTVFAVYPNPVSSAATINYSLSAEGHVAIKVINSIGMEVATLVNTKQPAGEYVIQWNAARMSPGIYFIQLKTEKGTGTYKIFIVK